MLRFFTLIVFLTPFVAHAGELPNILVYLSDDHSQFDSSLYGNANISTPNFEQLAEDGMVLNHAYVASPSCAPSRAAMLTGLMPARNGAEDNHSYPRPGVKSLIENIKALGYETAAIGKVTHNIKRSKFVSFDYINDTKSYPQIQQSVSDFLQARKSKRPLCLFVGISNPHVPWPEKYQVDPARVAFPPHHLDTPKTRTHRAAYYQEIIDLDKLLGELRVMADTYLGDNTIFIHTSDHGSQWPFGKWTLYDYGTRVPFIASWKGHIPAGKTSDAMVSWVDILPTLIELAGGPAPKDIDGQSFAKVLMGKIRQHRDRIFTTNTGDKKMNVYPSRSVRTAEWKLIHNLHPEFAFTNHSDLLRKPFAGAYWGEWVALAKKDKRAKQIVDRYYQRPEFELYRVSEDKWEQHNLVDDPKYAKVVATLKKELRDWMDSQNDKEPVFHSPRLIKDPESWHPRFFAERLKKRNKK